MIPSVIDTRIIQFIWRRKLNEILKLARDSSFQIDDVSILYHHLMKSNGDLRALNGKEYYIFKACIYPLLLIPCDGVDGSVCPGSNFIEYDLILRSYRVGEFLCSLCLYDKELKNQI